MQAKNNTPFLILVYTFIALLLLSVISSQFKLSTPIHIFSDLQTKPVAAQRQSTYKPKTKPLKQLVKDTIAANVAVAKIIRNDVAIETVDTANEGLSSFLTALHLHKKKSAKVRIGYFGDSMIEGDLITQTVRHILQNRFGGSGVGFIPVTSIVAHFRQTVRVQASDNWGNVHMLNNNKKLLLGFSGHSFFANELSTINIKAQGGGYLNSLYNLSILHGATNGEALRFVFNQKSYSLQANNYMNQMVLNVDSNISKAQFTFNKSGTPIFGFAAESKTGVILDNLSFRGTCGAELLKLNATMLKQTDSIRPYQLLVLHYGPNLLYADTITNFDYYKRQLSKSVKHLKKAFPHASILIIGTADKAFKIDGEYRTGDGVEQLLKAQQEVAQKYHCAFFNLYEAMGGYNSMKTWVEKKPILAGSDYTHFNQSGSAKIGRLIANAILNEYEKNYPAQ